MHPIHLIMLKKQDAFTVTHLHMVAILKALQSFLIKKKKNVKVIFGPFTAFFHSDGGRKVRERAERWHAAKGCGLDSNPGHCHKDSTLMVC